MKKLVLTRLQSDETRTLGRLSVFMGLSEQARFVTLEPPWKSNKTAQSCIPAGKYPIMPRSSQKFGDHLILDDVEGREFILIHRGNFPNDSTGCILLGMRFSDIDNDGKIDIAGSADAMGILVQLVREEAVLIIND